jgi:hypothetical protein
MTKEVFIPIIGYEGLYEVSDLGNVKALENIRFHYLSGTQTIKEKLLKPSPRGGYLLVKLTKNGIIKTLSVHRLVAIAFIKNPNNLPEVNHKDTIKSNNKLSNLEWCNGEYNRNHAAEMGRTIILKGEQHGNSKLTTEKVLNIRTQYDPKKRNGTKIANIFGISKGCLHDVISCKTWKHV